MKTFMLVALSLLFLSCSTTGEIKRPMSLGLPFGLIEANIAKSIDTWGLIIAIEKYPNFPSADYAESDARLIKEYYMKVLGVPEENIISLFGSDATKSRIKGYLKSYLPKNISEDTTLYIYYGGHGIPFPGQEKVEPYRYHHRDRLQA